MLFKRCARHNRIQPCADCVILDGFALHGHQGKHPPTAFAQKAAEKIGRILEPVAVPKVDPPAMCPKHPEHLDGVCIDCAGAALAAAGDPAGDPYRAALSNVLRAAHDAGWKGGYGSGRAAAG